MAADFTLTPEQIDAISRGEAIDLSPMAAETSVAPQPVAPLEKDYNVEAAQGNVLEGQVEYTPSIIEAINTKYKQGVFDHHENMEGFYGLTTGDESALQNRSPEEVEQMNELLKDSKDIPENLLYKGAGIIAQAGPGLQQSLEFAAIGAAGGAALGLVGGPLAPLTSSAGAAIGATGGFAAAGFVQMAGGMYKTLRHLRTPEFPEGVDKQVAKQAAFASGTIGAALDAVSGGVMTKIGKSAAIQALRSTAAKATQRSLVAKLFGSMSRGAVAEGTTEGLQELSDGIIEVTAEMVDKYEDVVFQLNDPKVREEFGLRLAKAKLLARTVEGAIGGALVGGTLGKGVELGGKAVGTAASKIEGLAPKTAADPTGGAGLGGKGVAESSNDFMTAVKRVFPEFMEELRAAKQPKEKTDTSEAKGLDDIFPTKVEDAVKLDETGAAETITNKLAAEILPTQDLLALRQKAIDIEVLALDEEINSVQAEIITREENTEVKRVKVDSPLAEFRQETGKPTTAPQEVAAPKPTVTLGKKLDKLYDKRLELEAEYEAIESGSLKPEDVAKGVKVSGDALLKFQKKAVSRLIKNTRAGFVEGVKYSKQQARIIQNSMVSFLKQQGATRQELGQFISKINRTQTAEQLEVALPELTAKVEAVIERRERVIAKAKLEKTVKASKPNPKEKGDADIEDAKNEVRNYIKESLKGKRDEQVDAERLEKLSEKSPHELTDREVLEKEALELGNLKEADSTTLTAANKLLTQLKDISKLAAIERREAYRDSTIRNQEMAEKSVIGNVPMFDPSVPEKKRAAERRKRFKATEFIRPLEGLLRLASQHDKNLTLMEELDPFPAGRDMDALVERYSLAVEQNISKSYNTKNKFEIKKKVADLESDKNAVVLTWLDDDGNPKTERFTKAQLISAYMYSKRPAARGHLTDGNGFSFLKEGSKIDPEETFEQQMLDNLDPEDIAYANRTFNLLKEHGLETNAFYKEKFGKNLSLEEFYIPMRVSDFMGKDPYKENADYILNAVKPKGGVPGSLKKTSKGATNPLRIININELLQSHLFQVNHFMTHYDLNEKLNQVFGSRVTREKVKPKDKPPEVMSIIENKYGPSLGKTIRRQMEFYRTGQTFPGKWDGYFSRMNRGLAELWLNFKPTQFVLQATSLVTALDEVGPITLTKSIADFANPETRKTMIETMQEHPTFRTRGANLDVHLAEATSLYGIPNSEIGASRWREWGQFLNSKGDKIPGYIGGYPIFKKKLKETGDRQKALDYAAKWIEQTQSSSREFQRNSLEIEGGLTRAITLFTKAQTQYVNKSTDAVMDYFNGRKNATEALRTISIYWLGTTYLYQVPGLMATALFSPEEFEDIALNDIAAWLTTGLAGPMGGMPGVGAIISSAAVMASNAIWKADVKNYNAQVMVFDMANGLIRNTESLLKDLEKDPPSPAEFLQVLADYNKTSPFLTGFTKGLRPVANQVMQTLAALGWYAEGEIDEAKVLQVLTTGKGTSGLLAKRRQKKDNKDGAGASLRGRPKIRTRPRMKARGRIRTRK